MKVPGRLTVKRCKADFHRIVAKPFKLFHASVNALTCGQPKVRHAKFAFARLEPEACLAEILTTLSRRSFLLSAGAAGLVASSGL
ncbi:MAG: hypothetical protein ACK4ZJ_16500, partial [Allorhizobium sp.]